MGSAIFVVQSIPTTSPSLGKVIDALTKKGKTPRGSGILVNIADKVEGKCEDYAPRIKEGIAYVPVGTMRVNLDNLIEENTSMGITQPITPVPLYSR